MTSNLFDLTGKVAIITGASRGIGEAIAHTYAAAGASVVVSSRKQDGVEAVAAQIRQAGGQALAVAAHMGDREAVENLIQRAVEAFGGVDIAVNNAAINPHFGPLLAATDSMWDKTLDVNVKGYIRLIQAVAPIMQTRGGGKIINNASIAGLRTAPNMGLYSISKTSVLMMTKVLANELAPHNIQVNALAPGLIKTKFSQALWKNPQISERAIKGIPQKRIGSVDEITGIALYLAAPASNFTTGATFVVDGGASIAGAMHRG